MVGRGSLHARPARGRGVLAALVLVGMAGVGFGQSPVPRPTTGLTVITREARTSLPTTVVNNVEVASLDDLARLFQFTVRDDTLAGNLQLAARGRTIVLSTSQGLASASGRLISLSGPPVKQGRSWAVPLDTIGRALPLLLDTRVDLRRDSRLVVIGDLRVPRLTVRVEPLSAPARVVVDVQPATPHVVEQEPGRLLVKFEAEALDASIQLAQTSDVLAGLHLVDGSPHLVVDVGPAFASFRASDVPGDRGASRLTIDLAGSGTAPAAVPAPVTPSPAPPSEPAAPPLFEQPKSALATIVLDPGHGGDETGAKGPGGLFEKDIVLGVARQLKGLLEARMGVRVLLTRDGDQTVPLDQRAALANNNKADLFISLHANASVRASARGAEVFYLSAGEYNAEARQQAAMEGELLPVFSGGDRSVEMILWDMAQLQHLEDSSALAHIVEAQLRKRVTMTAGAIQQAPFRVLVGANMPAVLVEMGFITNPDEEKLLGSNPHQGVLAQALYDSLAQFRDYLENGRRVPATTGEPVPGPPRAPDAASGVR